MPIHVSVFLLVVCLLLCLARLGWLDWFPLRPSSSKGGAKRSRLPRLLKPRSPDDCLVCRLACTPPPSGKSASAPVRPWREVKSRRGAPKRIDTHGYACPKQQCAYFGNTDAHIHATFRGRQEWPYRADPDVSLSDVPHHLHVQAQHASVSSENPFAAGRHGAVCPR